MPFLRNLTLAVTLAGMALSAPAALAADVASDRPRLALVLQNGKPLEAPLRTQLGETRRVTLLDDAAAVGAALTRAKVPLTEALTAGQARLGREKAKVDLVLAGTLAKQGAESRLNARLFDFRTGSVSRELKLAGESPEALATSVAAYIRSALPLRALVRERTDEGVTFDLGSADGVTAGSLYKVLRNPQTLAPQEVGLVRVRTSQPFASLAELESGQARAGDLLVEQTGDRLLKNAP